MLPWLGLCLLAGLPGLGGGALTLPVSRGSSDAGRDLLARFGAQPHRLPRGGADYFYTRVEVGTPLQPFDLILDTGSSLMFLPCVSSCTDCGAHAHTDGPLNSSSLRSVDCSTEVCTQDAGLPTPWCTHGSCQYHIAYQEGSGSTGRLMADALRLGSDTATTSVMFGCTVTESGQLKSQSADGLMGLGRGSLSLPQQLGALQEGSAGSFSLCLSGSQPGAIVFGAVEPPANLQWTPLLPRLSGSPHNWYRIATVQMEVGQVQLPLTSDDFSKNAYYGTLVDSGSTDLLLPTPVYTAFIAELRRQMQGLVSNDTGPTGNLCFQDVEFLWEVLPTISLIFQDGCRLDLDPINYVTREAQGYCLNVFNNHQYGLIVGSLAMLDTLVVFDLPNGRIGFVDFDCSVGLNASNASQVTGGIEEGASSWMTARTLILLSLIPVVLLAVLVLVYWLRASYLASAYGAMQEADSSAHPDDTSVGEETDVELQSAAPLQRPEECLATTESLTPVLTC